MTIEKNKAHFVEEKIMEYLSVSPDGGPQESVNIPQDLGKAFKNRDEAVDFLIELGMNRNEARKLADKAFS